MTDASQDAIAFDQFLEGPAAEVAYIARALRLAVLQAFPDAVEWFDPSAGCWDLVLAAPWLISVSRSFRTRRT